jgi:molecular chaperone DnaK (HSP70)
VVTYSIDRPERVLDWGFGAIRTRDTQKAQLFEWFKLLLQPESINENSAGNIRELTTLKGLLHTYNKTAEDVTVDYLRCIWRHTEKQLLKQLGSKLFVEFSIKVIFTIPAIWEPHSRNKVKALAFKAGLPTDIDFVQEPEAAAVEVLKGSDRVNVGDIITVCDAGGGTCVRCNFHLNKNRNTLILCLGS